ncbi:hypothetical protein [Massilia sp. IC2-476]|uniref:hypothetical protein n=1 Tax=Massilia sp. IC2-476 TaxID=2887199 RepID=UPI001D12E497|nr:hypothetical protein [Massilia sp. IC2-476]MCC2974214.1 hypothetical protein [Massilia sp. IC2-476]
MSDVGYTIIEPPSLGEWLGTVKNCGMLVALLTWLRHRLSEALKDDFPVLRIDVIKVEYLGTYPALGIQCSDDVPSDIDARLNDLTNRILSDSSVTDFLNFALDDGIDWTAEAQTLLSP